MVGVRASDPRAGSGTHVLVLRRALHGERRNADRAVQRGRRSQAPLGPHRGLPRRDGIGSSRQRTHLNPDDASRRWRPAPDRERRSALQLPLESGHGYGAARTMAERHLGDAQHPDPGLEAAAVGEVFMSLAVAVAAHRAQLQAYPLIGGHAGLAESSKRWRSTRTTGGRSRTTSGFWMRWRAPG